MGMQQVLPLNFKRFAIGFKLALTLFFFLFTAFPQKTLAQDVLESIRFDSRWPDASPGNLAQAGGSLFFAAGNVLVISDAETFTEQSRIILDAPRGITDIATDASGNVVYAACGKGGLKIVNTNDKSDPFLYATLENDDDGDPIEATSLDLGAMETFVYLADNTFGLRIIDVSTPGSPNYYAGYEELSRYTDEEGEETTVSGGYINVVAEESQELAFILDQYLGLRILDISNTSNIEQLGQFDMRSSLYFGQLAQVVDLTADNKYVYVSDAAYGIAILDYFSDPARPETVVIEKEGQIKSAGSASGLCLSTNGNTLFLADGNAGLLVADISNPTSADFDQTEDPSYSENIVKTKSYDATGAYSVIESQGTVFLANAENGIAELQHSSGLIYEETGNIFDPPADATALAIEGDYAYVLDNGGATEGMRIIELQNQETGRSRLAGFVQTPGNAFAVAAIENYAWIADGTEGVTSVNISDPDSPVLINQSFDAPNDARDIKILEYEDGSVYAFIADNGSSNPGLIIAETDSQGGLIHTDWVSIPNARAVATYEEKTKKGNVKARYALVANTMGLNIVDVTDPANPGTPQFLDTSDGGGQARDVEANPPYAVVANGAGGILLVDLSDPENPRQIDSFEAQGTSEAIYIHESYIHVALGKRGLLVLGISDTDPIELTPIDIDPNEDRESPYYNTPGYATDVAVAGDGNNRYTYLADTHGGFLAFLHSEQIGGGIDEQPFEESSDDTGCFIKTLNIKY